MVVGNTPVAFGGLKQGPAGLSSDLAASLEVGLDRGFSSVILVNREQWGLITQEALEG